MTITLYSGTPGSGKSLHAARTIRDWLRYKKRPVVANFSIRKPEDWKGDFTYIRNAEITPERLLRLSKRVFEETTFREDYILLVLDECQLLWNSRDWDNPLRMAWLEFFSQHRKYGYQVIFIAQDARMIDRQFRSLIEYEINHRKAGNYGVFGSILKILAFGELFLAVRYYFPLGDKVGSEWFRYDKKAASIYDSYALFEKTGT